MSLEYEYTPKIVLREPVAPKTVISWDPVTNSGDIYFYCEEAVTDKESSEFVGLEPTRSGIRVVQVSISEVLGMTIDTPYGPVSGPQLMLAVKALFAEKYAAALASSVAPEEPVPPEEPVVIEEPIVPEEPVP